MEEKLLAAKELLKKFGQEQLLDNYDRLSPEKQNQLLNEILTTDFKQVNSLYESTKLKPNFENDKIEPINYVTKANLTQEEYDKYNRIGEEVIKQGKLAVVTMAGGQGTRLGHSGPKGTFDLGLPSHKSIFELICDTLKEAVAKYRVDIPWYLMTSEENYQATVDFFEKHNYFDYPKNEVKFFKQGKLPMLNTEGKILLNEEGTSKQAADGHGGIFEAMRKDGVLYDMKEKGIEWVFIGGVDNVLVRMVDPILTGLAISQGNLAAGKSVVKANPQEKVGVFCKRNGRPSVIEYTEISKQLAEATDEKGELLYGESHILCNQFHISMLEEISKNKLPYHVAFKKASYMDKNGEIVTPEEPNAYKFEAFLFDAFSQVPEMTILRVKREEEFAPVKNATGVDSPETARALYEALHHTEKEYMVKYHEWLNHPAISNEDKQELRAIANDEKEIEDCFYKDLEFGTAGLRGVIGMGTNRMNKYTVGKATQGLANYIIKKQGKTKGVAIAYDSRRMSPEFSELAALCLNANGIKTYRFDSLRPTPELSFAVRELGCIAGIVVTASHNPPEYNGYKVYWEDGAQIVEPTDGEIISEVNNVTDLSTIKTMPKDEAIEQGLYQIIGEAVDKRYMEELKKLVVNWEAIEQMQKDIKIVYTPLHGTGNIPVQTILKELGFENVYVVPEQEKPDGNFPTVDYPNPEDPKAFKLALQLAKEKDADLVLANDPDADRLGVYAKNTKTGEYIAFNGNMTGNLIAEYILSQKKAHGALPQNGAIIKTIVSSNLTDAIAKEYGVELYSTLTGFKNIAKIIRGFEENNNDHICLFSYEESYGCIIGTHARDKDGIVAVMTLCEAACYYKQKGLTLWDQMLNIYEKYGYYKEKQFSITLKGVEGAEKIKQMMVNMRQNVPATLGKYQVLEVGDYLEQTILNVTTGEKRPTNLPKSNVLYYALENDYWCCVRPSGTEPKIKFYMGVKANSLEQADKELDELEEIMKQKSEQ